LVLSGCTINSQAKIEKATIGSTNRIQ